MHITRLIVLTSLVLSISWLVYIYDPQVNFDITPDENKYQVSLENIDITLADNFQWQGQFKAQSTLYLEQGFIFDQINGQFYKNELKLNITAKKGFWPHHEQKIYLYEDINVTNLETEFQAQELVIDLVEGTCMSPSSVAWSYDNITAVSPSLEKKITTIKKTFWNK